VLVLLVASGASAVHVCDTSFGDFADLHSAHEISASHVFCTICALVHSPSLTGLQFSIAPFSEFSIYAGAPPVPRPALLQTLALSVRAPPAL
jgi:hypothetical protein